MHRSHISPRKRAVRSRLAQWAQDKTLVHGTLSVRYIKCGKRSCHCVEGERHRAVYLVSKAKGKNRQVFVPPHLETEVRRWVDNYHRALELLEQVSEEAWAELKRRKEQGDS